MQLLKKIIIIIIIKKKIKKTINNHGMGRVHGRGRGGGGAVWTVNPPMNECIEVSVRKMSITTQLEQEFENI